MLTKFRSHHTFVGKIKFSSVIIMESFTSKETSSMDPMESIDVSFSTGPGDVQHQEKSLPIDAGKILVSNSGEVPDTHSDIMCEKQTNQADETETCLKKALNNVFVMWMNDENGKITNTELKWTHKNCSMCTNKFDEWKTHVRHTHQILVDAVKDAEKIRKLGFDKGVKVKTEKTELSSAISNPNQKSIDLVSKKVPIKRKCLRRSISKVSSTKPNNKSKYSKRKQVLVKKEPAEETTIVSPVLKKRKQSHPCRFQSAEISSEKSSDSDFEADELHSPEVSDDSDYAPQVKTRAGMLKRKRSVNNAKSKAVIICSMDNCEKTFTTVKERRSHEKVVHEGIHYECRTEGCNDRFKTTKGRDAHEKAHQGIYECDYDQCQLIFSSKKERAEHKKTHTSFKCGFHDCDKTFTTKSGMKRHRQLHTAERSFLCPVCAKTFISKKNLDSHMNVHNDKNYNCDQCRKVFRNQKALEKHKRLHTGEGLLVCQYCGKKLNSKPSLERHERLHTGDKPYQCKFCTKSFVCQSMLQNHIQEHTGNQFVCAQCGREFRSKNNLQEHERIHTGEKPIKCDICGEEFRKASNLWSHKKRRHTATRDYKCQICNKAFFTPDSLRSHRVVHTGERNYECEYCHKGYANASARSAHIKQVHLGLKRKGNISKARRLKREARLAEANRHHKRTSDSLEHTRAKNEIFVQKESHLDTNIQAMNIIPITDSVIGNRTPGLLPGMIPPNLMADRRVAPPQVSHLPSGDPNQSDFYTMVDSIVQFSKEH